MVTRAHKDAVGMIVERFGAKTIGFKANLVDAMRRDDGACAPEHEEDFDALKHYINLVPDAYEIDEERRTVTCHEVEKSYLLSKVKCMRYGALFSVTDDYLWSARLFTWDTFGSNPREVDLFKFYIDYLSGAEKRRVG